MTGRQLEVPPVDAAGFRRGWVPRVMRIREAHPHEPVLVGTERVEERDGAISDPVGMIMLARDGIVGQLRGAGVAAALSAQQGREARDLVRVALLQPARV